jgi:hypothetical protein
MESSGPRHPISPIYNLGINNPIYRFKMANCYLYGEEAVTRINSYDHRCAVRRFESYHKLKHNKNNKKKGYRKFIHLHVIARPDTQVRCNRLHQYASSTAQRRRTGINIYLVYT